MHKTKQGSIQKLFGEYVQHCFDILSNINSLVSVLQIAEEVTNITKTNNGFELKASQTHHVEKLVLAFGNFLPAHPRFISQEFISSENYFQNAFESNLIQQAKNKQHITIIGSGLKMIDI